MKYLDLLIISVFYIFAMFYPVSASIIHVPGDQPTIQAGIDAASDGDTVLIADGTYTGEGNRGIDFNGKAVEVASENGADHCIIDAQYSDRCFVFQDGETMNSVIDGISIRNGYMEFGGGIHCSNNSSPAIRNCVIYENTALRQGAGIYCTNSSPFLSYCIIRQNSLKGRYSADFVEGVGFYCESSVPVIKNCKFSENRASQLNSVGGGIYSIDSLIILNTCIIESNYVKSSAGVELSYSAGSISNCFFIENCCDSGNGGGIACRDSTEIEISNCLIADNHGAFSGGGIHCISSDAFIYQCTIINNETSGTGGGIHCDGDSGPTIENCIIACNTADYTGGGIECSTLEPHTISNCWIYGNSSMNYGGGIYCQSQNATVITECVIENNYAKKEGGGIWASRDSPVIIGGTEGSGNYFIDNWSPAGADLFCSGYHGDAVNARYNRFAGFCRSDYYVSPPGFFDVEGCISDLTPITDQAYASPWGDDENDGASWDTAFRTVTRAVKSVWGTHSHPVTIHIAPGTYSETSSGERFPLPMQNYVTLKGENRNSVTLRSEDQDVVLYCRNDTHFMVNEIELVGGESYYYEAVVFMNESSAVISGCNVTTSNPAYGQGIYVRYSDAFITDCFIHDFTGHYDEAGIKINESSAVISDCIIADNSALEVNTYGGGIGSSNFDEDLYVTIDNCLIVNNYAYRGGGIFLGWGNYSIRNCTIASNSAYGLMSGGGICLSGAYSAEVTDCIVWYNSPGGIWGSANATYSDIQGGYSGEGNIQELPRFLTGPLGDYYLRSVETGQAYDSPCIDAGSDHASQICYETAFFTDETGITRSMVCLDELTTRIDSITDSGIVDMGYHYPPFTPSPTPAPTDTPSPPTVTPVWPEIGVRLEMPDDYFSPGDTCGLDAWIYNSTGAPIDRTPFFAVLSAGGEFWFWDDWTGEIDFVSIYVPTGRSLIQIIAPFDWPDTGGSSAQNLTFFAAMTDMEMNQVLGGDQGIGIWNFGYGPRR